MNRTFGSEYLEVVNQPVYGCVCQDDGRSPRLVRQIGGTDYWVGDDGFIYEK